MTLTIYNTLTRRKEPFRPLKPGRVKMYVCGPTVYDYIHIGNARPLIFFDVVRRYMSLIGFAVEYVQNFTDVDDKLIKKAAESGTTVPEVAEQFIDSYYRDAETLGIRKADHHPRVTDHIPEIVAFIEGLIDKGFAYAKDGDVYFRTHRYQGYGKLSHQNMEELQHGARVDVNENKEHPQDFVLWKKAKPGEIYWDSPWGEGRPGWHIECSAMAKRLLGDTIDIHGGGMDLQFPHHECELAQSEALHDGKPLARYWMHNGYIHINNEKMSKSLGNGVLVHQIVKQASPAALRFFMLSTHYRNPLNFSEEALLQAEQSLERIRNAVNNLDHRLKQVQEALAREGQEAASFGQTGREVRTGGAFKHALQIIGLRFHEKMRDDFNTADAITAMFDWAGEVNSHVAQAVVSEEALREARELFNEMNGVLGLLEEPEEVLLDEEVESLIEERTAARKAKRFDRADEIRDLLTERGIVLEDTPHGVRWRRA